MLQLDISNKLKVTWIRHDIFSPCPLLRKDDSAIDWKVECICNYTFHAESHIGDKFMMPKVKMITQDHKYSIQYTNIRGPLLLQSVMLSTKRLKPKGSRVFSFSFATDSYMLGYMIIWDDYIWESSTADGGGRSQQLTPALTSRQKKVWCKLRALLFPSDSRALEQSTELEPPQTVLSHHHVVAASYMVHFGVTPSSALCSYIMYTLSEARWCVTNNVINLISKSLVQIQWLVDVNTGALEKHTVSEDPGHSKTTDYRVINGVLP